VNAPDTLVPGVPPAEFRQLLGRFASGVTVLTTRTPAGEPIGMTASSVASVSLRPPLVLVSVDKAHDMHPALSAASHFVLNVLAANQEALSRRFAELETGRFDGVGYRASKQGIAVLDGVVAHIECEKQQAVPAGDHTVFLGLVVGGAVTDRRPLLYYRSGYADLQE
jgi:flavin reductase (DIM6/NTAB) family NADH-FMN oxidoreductase RutF